MTFSGLDGAEKTVEVLPTDEIDLADLVGDKPLPVSVHGNGAGA